MENEIALVPLEELLSEPVRNGIYKTKEFHGSGAKVVNMGELFSNPRLYDIPMKRLQLNAKEIAKCLLREGDLLFARRSLTAEGAGKCIIVKEVKEDTTFESSLIRSRPDPKKVNSDYLYYFFNSPHGRHLLGSILRQVAVAGITGSDLKRLLIPVPNLSRQGIIAHILSTLDDKIELNRQTNANLEAMARTLFKSWFVDFDPVIDNALAAGNPIPEPLQAKAQVRATLGDRRTPLPDGLREKFPDRFVVTEEMGWVPEGWTVSPLDAVLELIGGGTPKTNIAHYWGGDIPWFSVADAPSTSDVFVTSTEKSITEEGLNNSSARLLRKGNTIISARGTVGKCAITARPMAMNQSCYGVQGTNSYSDYYIYYTVLLKVADLQQRSHGSVFSTITRNTFQTIKIPVCPVVITHAFDDAVAAFMERILLNIQQVEILERTRDTLLPKLLSGELRIPEAEQKMAEAI